jgi:hypothetical protein
VTKMAVAIKDMEKKVREKHLKLVDTKEKKERVEYEFPYDDMYLLYNCIMEDLKKDK